MRRVSALLAGGAMAGLLVSCDLGTPATTYDAGGDALATGDVNGDGHVDLFTGLVPGALAGAFLTNDGDGGFTATEMTFESLPAPRVGGRWEIQLADADGDGFDDVLYGVRDPADEETPARDLFQVWVMLNDGDGGFGPAAPQIDLTLPDGSLAWDLAWTVGDVDGNCNPDVVMYYTSGSVRTWLGNGTGGFGAPVLTPPGLMVFGAIKLADVTADGRDDFVLGGAGVISPPTPTGAVVVGISDGSGAFPDPVTYFTVDVPGGALASVAAGDLDGDGDQDLVGPNTSFQGGTVDSLSVLLNNGDGSFASVVERAVPIDANQVRTGDFDSDGHVDVVLVANNKTKVLFGDGTTQFPRERAIGSTGGRVEVEQLNGDDKPDLVIRKDGTVTVFLNDL